MCAYIQKTGWGGGGVLYTLYLNIWCHQTFQGAFLLQYGIMGVLWDTDSFPTVKRRGELIAQTSSQCGNTGLQTFAASLYIIIF